MSTRQPSYYDYHANEQMHIGYSNRIFKDEVDARAFCSFHGDRLLGCVGTRENHILLCI